MSVTIHIPGPLREYASGQSRVSLAELPPTVGEALRALAALHPAVRDRVLNERGELRPHVNVFVGRESIRFSGGLQTPLADGAEVFILPAVSGG